MTFDNVSTDGAVMAQKHGADFGPVTTDCYTNAASIGSTVYFKV